MIFDFRIAIWLQSEAEEIGEIAEVGFFECAGFEAEGERVGIGGDGDGGDFQELLFEIFPSGDRGRGRFQILPFDRNEADTDGVQEFALI